MWMQGTGERFRAILSERSEFAAILRGAGLALVIRVLASAIAYGNMILLLRWMGHTQFAYYSFALACLMLLAYPATLGLPASALRFAAEYAGAKNWPKVVGLIRASSWISGGLGITVALVGSATVWLLARHLEQGYIAPTIISLAGVPILALSITNMEVIRGFGWLGLSWIPSQLGQPLLLLFCAAALMLTIGELPATLAVAAAVLAHSAMLLIQRVLLRARLEARGASGIEPSFDVRLWLRVAAPSILIFACLATTTQAGVIMVSMFLTPTDVAIYTVAASTSALLGFFAQATNALSAPNFAVLYAQMRHGHLQALFTRVVYWTLWPSLAGAAVLIAFGSPILRLIGPGFDQGHSLLAILTLGQLVNVFAGPVVNLLVMTGHQSTAARVWGCGTLLYVMLGLVATPLWGLLGAALALAGATLISNVWLAVLVFRELGIYPSILGSRFLRERLL
jgi:O-antigen/teichoic acid export membrane protein